MWQYPWFSSLPEDGRTEICVSRHDSNRLQGNLFLTCLSHLFPPFTAEALRVRIESTIITPFNNTDVDASFSSFLCSYVLGGSVRDDLVGKLLKATHALVSLFNYNGHRFHTDEKTQEETNFMGYPNPMLKLIPTSMPTRSFLSFQFVLLIINVLFFSLLPGS